MNDRKRRWTTSRSLLRRTSRALLLAGLTGTLGVACSNPLDVENPNKVPDESLNDPTAMVALANGAIASVTRGVQGVGGVYEAATDEITWIGSRDSWGQLDQGNVDLVVNEFVDNAFFYVGEARFMADRAISAGEAFAADPDLTDDERPDPDLLALSYLAGGIIYSTIADLFDDFVIPPSPEEAAPAIGPDNMVQLYDTAIQYLTSGLDIVRQSGNKDLETRLLAVRARVHHARAVWGLLNPPGSVPADPLVSDGEAMADAQAAIALMGAGSDYRYELTLNPDLLVGCLSFASQVNERGEIQIGPLYVSTDPDDPTEVTGIVLQDPIDGIVDPVIDATLDEFLTDAFVPMTITSEREMHLILAEGHLAAGNMASFTSEINAVRAFDDLTPYSGQIPALDMLIHERRVNLFLMYRRLSDMYRFGIQDPQWLSQSPAVTRPGTFLPITITEIQSNPMISG